MNRFAVPRCRTRGSPHVIVHDRTENGLIVDCIACEDRWLVSKPARQDTRHPAQVKDLP